MDILTLFRQGLLLVVILSAPPLLVAVISGVIISLVQAAMQLQDQTYRGRPDAGAYRALGRC